MASVWNRTERDLRRGWHGFLKSAFLVLQDDADLYVGLWGKSWSWIWPLLPLALGGMALFTMLGLWSFQVSSGLAVAGPWWWIPEGTGLFGLLMGMAAGEGGLVSKSLQPSWPLTRLQKGRLRLVGPFLSPFAFLALVSGIVAAGPWCFHAGSMTVAALVGLPIVAFRIGMGFRRLPSAARLWRVFGRSRPSDGPVNLDAFFQQMAGRTHAGRVGFFIAIPLFLTSHPILGFCALGFAWAMVQGDLLRLEGRGSTLVAFLPGSSKAKLDARLRGTARWSLPSALASLAALGFSLGPVGLLPGCLALLGTHLAGDAIGLWVSTMGPLAEWSLVSLQGLGLMTLVGGAASGWLFMEALRDPAILLVQAMLAAMAWLFLRRMRDQVIEGWAWIQEGLIQD